MLADDCHIIDLVHRLGLYLQARKNCGASFTDDGRSAIMGINRMQSSQQHEDIKGGIDLIIVSDCVAANPDEGCLKIATSLAFRLKEAFPETMIIAYGQEPNTPGFSDQQIRLNKLFINKRLFGLINKSAGSVLYIPFASNTTASILRAFVLCLFCRKKISVLFALQYPMNRFAKIVLRLSKVHVITLAKDSHRVFQSLLGNRAFYLKTGVDTDQFKPVSFEQKVELKKKYGILPDMKVVLHVGHLKTGRNLDILQTVDSRYYVLIVISSLTNKDADLKARLEKRQQTRIIDTYIENIQEIYQLADVYLFPVLLSGNCIDSPLSVLEAAACNLPIVTTPYGELKELIDNAGFYPLISCSESEVASQIETAMSCQNIHTRETVLEYDWKKSVTKLESIVE